MKTFIRYILIPIGVIALAILLYIAGLTIFYIRVIQSGSRAALPQFVGRFTVASTLTSQGPSAAVRVATDDDPFLGNKNAPLTMVEFADFECPFSKEVYGSVREIAAKYPERVRVIFRDFPLSDIHPNALGAAIAANCAGEQGKFWTMHDKLFSRAPALSSDDLLRYADEIGLDRIKFSSCLNDPAMAAEVEADYADGVAAGIRGTPTFFFNGQKVEGAIPRSYLQQMVERMIQQP